MHIIWDRARGNLKNHAMGKKSVGISFFSGYAHFVKWARSTGNFSILTSPPTKKQTLEKEIRQITRAHLGLPYIIPVLFM